MGYASVFEWDYVEASGEAQTLAFEAACAKEREEDLATAIPHVESDEEDDESDELQSHRGNVIPNWNNIRGLGKREHNSGCELVERRITPWQREGGQTTKVEVHAESGASWERVTDYSARKKMNNYHINFKKLMWDF